MLSPLYPLYWLVYEVNSCLWTHLGSKGDISNGNILHYYLLFIIIIFNNFNIYKLSFASILFLIFIKKNYYFKIIINDN